MPTVEDAIALAALAHQGQVERNGQPYIQHPLRVMLKLESKTEKVVGVLHDVVEDTHHTLDDLKKMGYTAEIIEAVDLLSRRPGDSYDDFIMRIKPNSLARKVKLADLADNLDRSRLPSVTPRDEVRFEKYIKARRELMSAEDILEF